MLRKGPSRPSGQRMSTLNGSAAPTGYRRAGRAGGRRLAIVGFAERR
jgi:hypothetical protein